MNQFKTVEQVWAALYRNETVYWGNDSYQITIESQNDSDWLKRHGYPIHWTTRNGLVLRVTCMSNWFGSLLDESELSQLYTKVV